MDKFILNCDDQCSTTNQHQEQKHDKSAVM